LTGSIAAWWTCAQGFTLYYGDAESHLNTARRIIDSRTPGYEQLGTPWLPLPHAAMLPFAGDDRLWRSGLAGAIPGAIAFVAGGAFLFAATRRALDSKAAAWTAVLLYGLNPNLLYLQATPMTEHFFFAALLGVLYFSVRFRQTQAFWCVAAAGVLSLAATLSRYDGWILIPLITVYMLWAARRRRLAAALVFGVITSLGPLYWLGHNWYCFGDAFYFYNGPWSTKAIQGGDPYPGYHDWSKAWLFFRSAAQLCAGTPLAWLGVFGLAIAVFIKRAVWPVLLLGAVPAFYVLSIYSSSTPIFVPHLWFGSYYNTRYGLAALPVLVFGAAALAAVLPSGFRRAGAAAIVLVASAPWLLHPTPEAWICWKESQVNSVARRAWTEEAAEFFRRNYRPGAGILFSFGDLTGVLREAGIPLREGLHDGNNPQFDATLARPDLMLREEWALAISGDQVASALRKLGQTGTRYERVRMVAVEGGPVIEIYRRSRRVPAYAHPVHEGARR
jgi:hypothetical protein